jgi:hypothetical protein
MNLNTEKASEKELQFKINKIINFQNVVKFFSL